VKEGLDSIATAQADLDFQVSTDAASVRDFLDAPFTGTKIVFSTYQSAQVVGAALKPGEAFDLGVFDEAHKTAGREWRNYAFALEDANLPIRKRLFLTATPRHYNPHDRDREGEAKLLFSMDNPEVYGPQAYRLTFAEAARRGIICGYKVIISVITSEMVTNELLSHGEVVVNGDAVRARQVANQIALRDSIEKYGASKVFTFHKTVESAASFVADGSEGVRTHLPEFGTFHVNGTMPTARREREMRDFRAAARAVMSNARCLTEGVDVPAVDMVAFLSPRRSRVDIVQATGRAMRRSPGKTMGYVLVPLYVELATGETVEAAVNRAQFDEVWDVLQSMQEQDDILAEAIRKMRLQKGRKLGFDDAGFRDRIEVCGPRITLEGVRAAITTTCIEKLGSPWDERFGELVAYKDRFGDCDVPTRWGEGRRLATWVVGQRQARKLGKLSAEKIEKLDQIGFLWNPLEALWEHYLEKLATFRKTHGHSNPSQLLKDHKGLGAWVTKQRLLRTEGLLSSGRIAQLDELGMVWSPRDDAWHRMFTKLTEYHAKHGHANVSTGDAGEWQLAHWLTVQRRRHRQKKLSAECIMLLNDLGIDWDPEASSWEAMFASLVEFKKRHEHFRVPRPWPEQPSLPNWVIHQRRLNKKEALSTERVRRLNQIGFSWNPHEFLKRLSADSQSEAEWQARFNQLVQFKAKHEHCDVPRYWPENPALGGWLARQRWLKRTGKLDAEKQQMLDQLRGGWSIRKFRLAPTRSGNWMAQYQELLRFKQCHGHCNVSFRLLENAGLAGWVSRQRQAKKSGKLLPERKRLLNEIGFA
jgi:superfamily II DNA or RNA helicase